MYTPPLNECFDYPVIERIDGKIRLYVTHSGNLPSVTTILSKTEDPDTKAGLKAWRDWVGDAKADEIVKEACDIGTLMHENLENRLIGAEEHKGTMPMRKLARRMADVIQKNAWPNINEVWSQEKPLFYEGLWAGTSDLIGVHDGTPAIMDYKNSRQPKKWEKIKNYRLQCAAYALAHNQMFGTDIKKGVIFVCVRKDPENLVYQEFVVEGQDFEDAKVEWIERVEQYYTQFETKE
ncbi:restriction endonuclease type II-like protein [Vibrio phage 2.275.O._10N.286.54.E11]|nr:restriction endonuclease type II-like protein [Vibrio phage 2.275.O._10N.286.54.E11]